MPSEGGDMKLLGNYRKLIDLLLAEPTYEIHLRVRKVHERVR